MVNGLRDLLLLREPNRPRNGMFWRSIPGEGVVSTTVFSGSNVKRCARDFCSIELQAYLGTSADAEVSGSGHTVFAQKTPATFAAGQCSNMIRLHARKWLPVVRTSSINKT